LDDAISHLVAVSIVRASMEWGNTFKKAVVQPELVMFVVDMTRVAVTERSVREKVGLLMNDVVECITIPTSCEWICAYLMRLNIALGERLTKPLPIFLKVGCCSAARHAVVSQFYSPRLVARGLLRAILLSSGLLPSQSLRPQGISAEHWATAVDAAQDAVTKELCREAPNERLVLCALKFSEEAVEEEEEEEKLIVGQLTLQCLDFLQVWARWAMNLR